MLAHSFCGSFEEEKSMHSSRFAFWSVQTQQGFGCPFVSLHSQLLVLAAASRTFAGAAVVSLRFAPMLAAVGGATPIN
jgi:hypothetical protein